MRNVCLIEDCGLPCKGHGYCNKHYQRFKTHGDPMVVLHGGPRPGSPGRPSSRKGIRKPPVPCSIDDCDDPASARGWCSRHWQRWRKWGDPLKLVGLKGRGCGQKPGQPGTSRAHVPKGSAHGRWQGDDITYHTAHRRVVDVRGKASAWPCVDCGSPAEQWSYNHRDPDEKIERVPADRFWGERVLAYSTRVENYDPRCNSCHRKFDRDHGRVSR